MSPTDRHREAVRATASAALADPIGIEHLRVPSGERLRAARAQARAALEAAERHHSEVAAELHDARREEQRIASAIDRCSTTTEQAQQERSVAGEEASALRDRLVDIDAHIGRLSADLDDQGRALEQLDALQERLSRTVDSLVGRPLTPGDPGPDELEEWSGACDRLGLTEAAEVLREWAAALRAGTAEVHAEACVLLNDLDELDDRWRAEGSGDIEADAEVLAARSDVRSCRDDLEKLVSQGRTGALGERLRRSIEQAHADRVELEAQGRKADPVELAAAIEAESAALGLVGFDSMLDYRVAMSTAGAGSLAESRRRLAEERLSGATTRLDRVIEESRARHATLRELRAAAERRAREFLGEHSGGLALRDVLRTVHVLPAEVQLVVDDVIAAAERARVAVASLSAERAELASEQVRASERVRALDAAVDRTIGVIDRMDDETRRAAADLEQVTRRVEEVEHRLGSCERDRAAAGERLADLDRRRYVHEDVADLRHQLLSVVGEVAGAVNTRAGHHPMGGRSGPEAVEAGAAHGPLAVVVDDPLVALDTADAVAVLDALFAVPWPAPVLFVTSRPELLAGKERRNGPVRCVDGRRKVRTSRRWGRRRDALSEMLAPESR